MKRNGVVRREARVVNGLELISCWPAGARCNQALLFVHGAFSGAWCWDEYFLPYFARHGYPAHALSLRGHGTSSGHEALALAGIDDYVADVILIANSTGSQLVLVGHSMGAIVVQRAIRRHRVAGAVLMAPVPPQGLAGSALLLAARDPELFREINLIQHAHPRYATLVGLRKAMFSQALPPEDAARHFQRMQPESQRAMFDLAWPQYFWIGGADRTPVLVMGAENDAFFPIHMIEETARVHGVQAEIIPDMAHAMMLEPHWRRPAERILEWLRERTSTA